MFRSQSHLRRWAARMLVLWVLGVVVGVAHACLAPSVVGLAGQPAGDAVVDSTIAVVVLQELHHEATVDSGVGHHDQSDESNCKAFCEKSAVSIPPLKTSLDDLHGQVLPPSACAIAVAPPVVSPADLMLPRRDGGLALPIAIAFLRLAL